MRLIKIYTFIFILVLPASCIFAQGLTQQDKNTIIAALDSSSPEVSYEALKKIQNYKIVEAVPYLESRIWAKNCITRAGYLVTLEKLGAPNLHAIALQCVDSASNCSRNNSFDNPLELKITATSVLFKLNDYSSVKCIFDMLRHDVFDPTALALLPKVIENVPGYADSAKAALFNIVNQETSTEGNSRLWAFYYIHKYYGAEAIPLAVNMVRNDIKDVNRLEAFKYLCNSKYSGLNALIKEIIYTEPAASYRHFYADTLLSEFGAPSDYKFVEDFTAQESDPITKRILNRSLNNFVPPPPAEDKTASEVLDSLISYNAAAFDYGWTDNKGIFNSLNKKLLNAKMNLEKDELKTAVNEIEAFGNELDAQKGKHVSNKAFNYLHSYALYLRYTIK